MSGDGTPLPVRPDLADLLPYVSPQQPARYRMNTNESPYPPPEGFVEALARAVRSTSLNRYPDKDAGDLVAALSAHVGCPPEQLWVANGSNEVLLHLFLAFGGAGRTSLTFEPTYSLHSLIPRIAGTTIAQLPRTDDFTIDLAAAATEIDRTKPEIVLLCSPNNPSGGCERLGTIASLAEHIDGLVVVDEAYIEFADADDSALGLIDEHPNLVITRTFSKAWRIAGVRIGYLLAADEIVQALARVRLPYHLSSLTQIAGVAALEYEHETLEIVGAIKEERDRIAMELQAMGLRTYPSKANFVLFEVDEPAELWSGLLARGVLVRDYSNQPGLTHCLRVTAGLPEETEAFVAAMKELLDER